MRIAQEKHFPTAHREIEQFRYNRDAREVMPRVIQSICEAIEDSYGRMTPNVYEDASFSRNRTRILQEILSDRHLDEKMGSSFINVIDRQLILETIQNKSEWYAVDW